MNNMFLDKYQFTKMAAKPLEGSILQWPAEIMRQLYSLYPELAYYPYTLDFHNVDEKTASAKGSIVIKKMEIPFIVEAGDLKPLLVYHQVDKPITTVMPITQSVIQELINPSSFDKSLTEKPSKDSPRVEASTTTIVQTKTASVLDLLDGTVKEADKKALLSELVSDVRMIDALDRNDTIDILEKVSKLTYKKADDEKQLEHDVHYIYKSAGLGWTKLSSNSKIYDPKVEILQTVGDGEQIIKTASAGKIFEIIKQAEVSDVFNIGNVDYKMVRMDDDLTSDGVILVNDKGNYINNFSKTASFSYSTDNVELPYTSDIQPGDTILVKTAENRFFGPVKVASSCKVKGKRHIKGDYKLKKAEFVETSALTKTVFDKKANVFYTPFNEYIKLASKTSIKKSYNDFVKSSHTVAKRHGQYYLIGPEFEKLSALSGVSNPYTKDEALWALIQLGASEETIKQAEVLSRTELKVEDKLKSPVSKDSLLEKTAEDTKLINMYIDQSFKGLIKEAVSSIADKKSLDVILGLNLINEENLLTVLDAIPAIEYALNVVSQLYLMSCVGLNSLDRGALETILQKLGKIRDSVSQLNYVLKGK